MDVNADGRCTKKSGPRQSILVSPRSRNGEFDACERYRVSARTDVLLLEFTSQVPFYERCLSNTAISDKQQLETRFLHRRSGRIFGSDSDGVRQITPPMRKITSREQRPNEATVGCRPAGGLFITGRTIGLLPNNSGGTIRGG
jgi:hypothetical protein